MFLGVAQKISIQHIDLQAVRRFGVTRRKA